GALSVIALQDPSDALRAAVADATGVGQVPADVATSPLAWLAVVVCLAVVGLGAWHATGRGSWSTPGARHDRAAEARSAVEGAEVLEDPARAWDALSDGTDPS
ncbi:MAG: Trp biosynthesis-associated membrane protein, partial [Actinomycetota bacterium]|nr:Trp biosynthesis-associated membrane protein [Actinomycetota bacterium]